MDSIPDDVIGVSSVDQNIFSYTIALVSTQLLIEMSIGNLPGNKGWSERKAYDLTAICENVRVSTSHNPTVSMVCDSDRFSFTFIAT
jgi:hypothetical protein